MSVHREQPRVLVVGGGIGGLACALALRTHGFDVDIVERSGVVTADKLTLTGRCVDALADLGVLAECKQRGRTPGSLYLTEFDQAGTSVSLGRPPEPHSAMPPTLMIERQVLIEVLSAAVAEAGAKVRVPCEVTSIEQCAGQVSVTFDDDSCGTYGLVVAADGVRSSLRRLVWGSEEVEPTPSGAIGVQWVAAGLPPCQPGFYYRHNGVVTISTMPDDVTCVSTFVDSDREITDGLGLELLREALDSYTAPALRALRERLDDTQKVVTQTWEWVFAPEWTRGRVALIGDAAHATTHWLPAGAGLALIDAVVLAEEIAEADDIPAGLDAYVERRWERALVVVQASVDAMRLRRDGDDRTARMLVVGALKSLVGPY